MSPIAPVSYIIKKTVRTLPFRIRWYSNRGPSNFRAHQSFANGQPPSKLRMTKRPYPAGSLLSPMKTKMENIKKVYFCTKLFKNTIFIMYEWWRFQWYRICLKKSEIKIGIEKFNYYFLITYGVCKKRK